MILPVLDPFYLIVDSAAWIARLLPCGVKLVQLRIKDKPRQTIQAEIEESKALCRSYGAQLVINDYWREAMEAGCDFVHLGQGDLETADLGALRKAVIRVGISTHSDKELSRALEAKPDYLALGPIYRTILKAMPFEPQGLARIGEWKRKIGAIPLVAIGGITLERIKGVLAAGADSAAVVTDVIMNADPEQRVRDFVAATRGATASLFSPSLTQRLPNCQLIDQGRDTIAVLPARVYRDADMIRLENVTKTYNGSLAVDDVSLTIDQGKTTSLIGPSGSGKSTLLSLMIGLERPDQGQITIDSQPLLQSSVLNLRRRMGYVIQDGGLFPHLTARENVCLMANEARWPPQQRTQRLSELCTLTRFPSDALDRYPAELSGGQRQRISLMRALMLDPDIILMDEPLGALDPIIKADLQDDLKSIFTQLGKTVVLVTHDLGEAAFFGDTIILLRKGRIVQQGKFRDLVDRPAEPFTTRFVEAHFRRGAIFGNCAVNFTARRM